MATYTLKRRPTTVQAVPFDGNNWGEVELFTGPRNFNRIAPRPVPGDGVMVAEVYNYLHCQWVGVFVGQWIVRGTLGELYPIDVAVARAGYEEPEGGWPGDVSASRAHRASAGQAEDPCRVYWGPHGCRYARGHDVEMFPHRCECCDHETHDEGSDCVGGPPYYGPSTHFYGEDFEGE
jgi:hypothetical protein